jgi:enoyl-CoA hydratase/carnithine racemase
MLHAIETYALPVVAVVQGDAIAGGNELALHCDFVIASETARFGMSLAKIGLAPSWFLAKKLLEVAGPVGAREMLLLGDLLPASRMAEMGLIHRTVPAADLEAAAQSVIGRLAANAPLSLKAMKAVLVRAMAFRDGIAHADVDALVAAASQSADAREGIAAMLERRAPRFEGR